MLLKADFIILKRVFLRDVVYAMSLLFVWPRASFHCGVFRAPKNETLKTNKPPALRVDIIALAYSKKPPVLQ